MGQVDCKRCSNGTYVSEERHPGKSPTDCYACPYGKDPTPLLDKLVHRFTICRQIIHNLILILHCRNLFPGWG